MIISKIALDENNDHEIFVVKYKGNDGNMYYTYPTTSIETAKIYAGHITERPREIRTYRLSTTVKYNMHEVTKNPKKIKKIKKIKKEDHKK